MHALAWALTWCCGGLAAGGRGWRRRWWWTGRPLGLPASQSPVSGPAQHSALEPADFAADAAGVLPHRASSVHLLFAANGWGLGCKLWAQHLTAPGQLGTISSSNSPWSAGDDLIILMPSCQLERSPELARPAGWLALSDKPQMMQAAKCSVPLPPAGLQACNAVCRRQICALPPANAPAHIDCCAVHVTCWGCLDDPSILRCMPIDAMQHLGGRFFS